MLFVGLAVRCWVGAVIHPSGGCCDPSDAAPWQQERGEGAEDESYNLSGTTELLVTHNRAPASDGLKGKMHYTEQVRLLALPCLISSSLCLRSLLHTKQLLATAAPHPLF
jgi:hypothetical protein